MENLINFGSFVEMLTKLPDEKSCREYLEASRWDKTPVCPKCGSESHYKLNTGGEFQGLHKCAGCNKRYTAKIGTIFENSHIPLRKWFIAIFIFSSHKRGISSHQLAKDLNITQKSAWFLLNRIRLVFQEKENVTGLKGVSGVDETFVGGKNKNRHKSKKVAFSQGRSYKDKTPVFGLINNGKVFTRVVPDTKAKTLKPIIKEMVEKGSILVTDDWLAYRGMNSDYDHKVVDHAGRQYSNDGFSTNNVENFWSHLKRGIYGTYYKVSAKHLHRYCDEYSYRFNTRKIKESVRFNHVLDQSKGLKLTYKELIKN